MSDKFTVRNFIRYFEARLRQIDRNGRGAVTGKEPQFPMLVVFLGEKAMKGYHALSTSLFRIWPQYQHEIQFLAVLERDSKTEYVHLVEGEEETVQKELSADGISDMVSALFGLRNHFQDRRKLLVYYVLHTDDMNGDNGYDRWAGIQKDTKGYLGMDELEMLDMFILLLNEGFSQKKAAGRIRNRLCEYYDKGRKDRCSSVFVLSNRRNDNAILEDWDPVYHMISAMIALSNNSDEKILGRLFDGKIMTASYAREEKPSEAIGQIVVRGLIDRLSAGRSVSEPHLQGDDTLPARLGLTREGTFLILDQYADRVLMTVLPSQAQLNLFPRKDMSERGDLSRLSVSEFNRITMNAWDSYLAQTVEQVRERVNADYSIRENWSHEYARQLQGNFSVDELVYLADHLSDIQSIWEQKREPSRQLQVLEAAGAELKYMLSSDERLKDIFLKIVETQGKKAWEYISVWNQLVQSRTKVFAVRDENITLFYEKKMRNYFDQYGAGLNEEFRRIQDTEELKRFLEFIIDKIIDSDAVFSSSFEEELEERLREKTLLSDARQYIRKKLTIDDVYTYLQVDFSFEQPILSAVLLKTGTPFYHNLSGNLAPDTYYYNTGCGDTAEAMTVYEVSTENLINGAV